MRPIILVMLLLTATCMPIISTISELEENSNQSRQTGGAINGASLSQSSGPMNESQAVTITGTGFLSMAENTISNDGLSHSWTTSIADSIQGGYGANGIAVTSNGDVHIVYFNYDTRQLKHAVYNGQSWSRSVISTAAAGSQYRFVELQVDSNDHLHVAHWVTGDYLNYRTYDGSSWTLNYTTTNVDSYGVSLALNSLNHAHISFSTPAYVCGDLGLAYFNASTSSWTKVILDSSSTYIGCYSSVGIDSNDAVHVTYRDHSNSRLNYITNESSSWDKYQLNNTQSPAYFNDLAVKSNDDVFIIQRNQNGIRYAEGTPGGIWTQGGVYSNNNGEENSLILDATDTPHLIHWHSSYDDLMYSTRTSSGSWSTVAIDSGSDDTGRRNSVTIDHNNQLHVAYSDVNNKMLKYATKSTGLVSSYTIEVQFGNLGNVTATVVSDTEMQLNTPTSTTTGNVSLGLWDSSGTYRPLNLNYYYTNPSDTDEDGVSNSQDDCPNTAGNSTIDQIGCPDSDGDGYSDSGDSFPLDATEWYDSDSDGVGDNADVFPNDSTETVDSDGDGVGDNSDEFPNDSSESVDSDGDGVGDNADAFPNDSSETLDSDGDGIGDNADAFPNDSTENADSDGDGVGDNSDIFPNDANETADSDGDGVGDSTDAFPNDSSEDTDSDGDGVGDNSDPFPNDGNETADSDGDGVGDNSDALPNDGNETTDSDGDGVGDNSDSFPNDSSEQADSDGDGIGDNSDAFPNDATEDTDTDSDGVGDNSDEFPNDPNEQADSDGDGYGDNADAFPTISTQWSDTDGDGYGDNWGSQSWNSVREQYGIGQYVPGAIRSDYCPENAGTSNIDGYFGCVDDDGDGIANIFEQNTTDTADDSEDDSSALPSIGIVGTLFATLLALLPNRKERIH